MVTTEENDEWIEEISNWSSNEIWDNVYDFLIQHEVHIIPRLGTGHYSEGLRCYGARNAHNKLCIVCGDDR